MSSFASRTPFANGKLSDLASAHNPVYNVERYSKCPYGDTRKTFKTTWQLHMHLQFHHANESNRKEISMGIAQQIISEMI